MTQPAAQGFPDWQRNTPAQNVIYLLLNTQVNGFTNYGPFFCGYSPATRIFVDQTNKNISVLVFWFADKALTQPLGQQEIVTQVNSNIDTAVSNQGPWFIIEFTAQTYPVTPILQVSAVAYTGNGLGLVHSNILIGSENAAIGIGGTLSIFSFLVWPGPAVLHLRMNQGPFTVSLAGIDITGARVPFYQRVEAAATSFTVPLFLPASIVRVIVTNSSGVAATCSVYVVADVSTRPGR